eukprot:UN12504
MYLMYLNSDVRYLLNTYLSHTYLTMIHKFISF